MQAYSNPKRESDPYALPVAYHQTDPRGCAVYIVRKADIPDGADIGSRYTRGVTVW